MEKTSASTSSSTVGDLGTADHFSIAQISGNVPENTWGVSEEFQVYRLVDWDKRLWQRVDTRNDRFNNISTGTDGSVFAIHHGDGLLFQWSFEQGRFTRVDGASGEAVTQISVGNSDNVFGISKDRRHNVVHWKRGSTSAVEQWSPLTKHKAMRVVSAGGPNGDIVVCISSEEGRVMHYKWDNGSFAPLPVHSGSDTHEGSWVRLDDVSVSPDGTIFGTQYRQSGAKGNDICMFDWQAEKWTIVQPGISHFAPVRNVTAMNSSGKTAEQGFKYRMMGIQRDGSLWIGSR